ncbi:hypothetical protein ACFTUC_39475 [Streptomyces sp. NPDC056944]|uniref:hypothetical protein n=1 Tax=unclassified Streptomyces TaxID=2593676 RepID=UPI00362E4271
MTTHPTPYARPLLLGLALLLAGAAVLLHPTAPEPDRAPSAAAHTASPTHPVARTDRATSPDRTTNTPTPRATSHATPQPVDGDQPVSGDGPAGDYAIQRLLDRSTPTDLPPTTAHHLTRLATRVWLAETTGTSRSAWPAYFTDTGLRAPYHGVRIQAAVAHRAGPSSSRAEVRLVWAGADAAGEFRDGRTARVLLKLHHNEWVPVR